jgi:poly(3-hydroxyalkanoate) synthetase
MSADVNLADIPERIQSEVQRAIQRSIKGVEYFSTSGPALGSTPKDILHTRGTMNLCHYRPLADEVYRVPVLIVMATTNRGYILDMLPGQTVNVAIGRNDQGFFELAVGLEVSVPDRDKAEIQELANIAHAEVCPYSRATRGNIEVKVRVI